MPELKCNVHTCVHNKNYLCDLDAIEVAGSSAQTARDTSCASFVEKQGTNYSNANYSNTMKEPAITSDITCHARECQYNDSCKCHAGKISVGGNEACRSEETECATFKKQA